jgi:hypothetical protein
VADTVWRIYRQELYPTIKKRRSPFSREGIPFVRSFWFANAVAPAVMLQ